MTKKSQSPSSARSAVKSLRAIIYCRRGPDDREGKEKAHLTLAAQREVCRALCEREGYRVVAEYIDDGYSGRCWPAGKAYDARTQADEVTERYTSTLVRQRRPGFANVLQEIEKGLADVVVVRDMKRFSRPILMSGFQYFLYEFTKAHQAAAVHSATEGRIDFADEFRIMCTLIQDAAEDTGIRHRIACARAAIDREREKGRYFAPRVPWGYQRTPEGFKPDGQASEIYRGICKDLLKGKTLAPLVARLQELKIPTPRGAKCWSRNTVAGMLKNPIFMGQIRLGDKLIPCVDVAAPIVDEKTFLRIQAQFAARKRPVIRSRVTGGLATGLVRCGRCDSAMVLFPDPMGRSSYRCSRRIELKCRTAIKSDNLDDFMSHFLDLHPIMAADRKKSESRVQSQLSRLYARESELSRRVRNLNERLVNPRVKFDSRHFTEATAKANEELERLRQEIAKLERLPTRTLPEEHTKEERRHFERQTLVRNIFDRVAVNDGNVEFTLAGGKVFSVRRSARSKNGLGHWLPEPISKTRSDKRLTLLLPYPAIDQTLRLLNGALEIRGA